MKLGITSKKIAVGLQYVFGVLVGHLLIPILLKSEENYDVAQKYLEPKGSKPTGLPVDNSPHLLIVGVMTTSKFLSTRACKVYQTWAPHIEGKVVFFAETNADLTGLPCTLPVVRLHGVTDAYPPQKKSFMMLRHLAREYGDKYRWFMRADDDVYVNWNTIHNLLRSIESKNTSLYIGQAGTGTLEEQGRLGLGRDQNFCMGGPGVILSSTTLGLLKPHIKNCLKNLRSSHEDVEVGRCIYNNLGISCTWAYEMMSMFYHSHTKKVPKTKFSLISKAVTLHPVKDSSEMVELHSNILSYKRRQLQSEMVSISTEIQRLSGNNMGNAEWPIWDTIVLRNFHSVNTSSSQMKYPSHLSEGLSTAINYIMLDINSMARERSRFVEFRDLHYAYYSNIPNRGAIQILDLFMIYKQFQKNINQKVRRHIHLEQKFLQPRARLLSASGFDHSKRVSIILPLYERQEQFDRFLGHYLSEFLSGAEEQQRQHQRLIVVFFSSENSTSREAVRLKLAKIQAGNPDFDSILLPVQGPFSRAKALDMGTKMCSSNDLMLFTDVDILLTTKSMQTIRLLTVENHSVYFPIVYSLFKENERTSHLGYFDDKKTGYWRYFGFGVVSLHKSDYIGMNLGIKGWGKEDVDLFDRFMARADISVFRACDPDFVHVYHPVVCDKGLDKEQYEMCLSSKANNHLSSLEAAKIILQRNILDSI